MTGTRGTSSVTPVKVGVEANGGRMPSTAAHPQVVACPRRSA